MATIWRFILLTMLLLAICSPAAAQDDVSVIRLELTGTSDFTVGTEFIVSVNASIVNATAYGFGLQIRYDPQYLEVVEKPDADGQTTPAQVGSLFNRAQRTTNTTFSGGTGTVIDVVYAFLGADQSATGDGTIVTVTFQVLAPGNTTVSLENPRLITIAPDETAQDIPIAVSQSVINVTNVPGPTAAPTGTPAPTEQVTATLPIEPSPTSEGGGTDEPPESDNNNTLNIGVIVILAIALGLAVGIILMRSRKS